MMKADFDLKQVVKDLLEVDPNMPREELFDHCILIGKQNGMETQHIIDLLQEILK